MSETVCPFGLDCAEQACPGPQVPFRAESTVSFFGFELIAGDDEYLLCGAAPSELNPEQDLQA